MINWELVQPRNLIVIGVIVVGAIAIFNFFSQTHKDEGQ